MFLFVGIVSSLEMNAEDNLLPARISHLFLDYTRFLNVLRAVTERDECRIDIRHINSVRFHHWNPPLDLLLNIFLLYQTMKH